MLILYSFFSKLFILHINDYVISFGGSFNFTRLENDN